MSNGIATFDDQEINNMLEEIKKNQVHAMN